MRVFSPHHRYRSVVLAQSGGLKRAHDPVKYVVFRAQEHVHHESLHHRVEYEESSHQDVLSPRNHAGMTKSLLWRLFREQIAPMLDARSAERAKMHDVTVVAGEPRV